MTKKNFSSSLLFNNYVDPEQLNGEGFYDLNGIIQEEVTESFLGLDQAVKECQNEEHYDECTTRQYIENMKDECGCLPLSIALSDQVNFSSSFFPNDTYLLTSPSQSPKSKKNGKGKSPPS